MKKYIKNFLKRIITSEIIRKIFNKFIFRDILFHESIENNNFFDFSSIDKKIIDELFAKTSLYWRDEGSQKCEMYYSVLTDDKYKKILSENEIKKFLLSGNSNISDALNYVKRFSKSNKKINSVLDFGCGVGRLSYNLPSSIKEIWCCDFSKSHLNEAKKNLSKKFKNNNLNFKYLSGINSIKDLPKQDLIYSFITLQHNTPPVMDYMINQLLQLLNNDGIAILHIPLVIVNYQFNHSEYLKSKKSGKSIEMHLLPRSNLYKSAIENNCELVFSECKGGCGGKTYSENVIFRKT